MRNRGTRFFIPETIQELGELISNEPDYTLLAGGTSLFKDIDGEILSVPGVVINLDNIEEFKKESRTERYFEFGSMLTIEDIINRSYKYLPEVLLKGLKAIAPFPVRNAATIGGTIANNKIVSDIIPLLLIFNCKIEILTFYKGKKRTKWEPINQYISTKNSRPNHIITRVRIPLASPGYSTYYKSGYRYNLFSEVSFSAIAEIEKKNISTVSMGFNIENRKIIRLKEVEALLVGVKVPIPRKDRDHLIQKSIDILSRKEELSQTHIYQLTQIILYFLEGF